MWSYCVGRASEAGCSARNSVGDGLRSARATGQKPPVSPRLTPPSPRETGNTYGACDPGPRALGYCHLVAGPRPGSETARQADHQSTSPSGLRAKRPSDISAPSPRLHRSLDGLNTPSPSGGSPLNTRSARAAGTRRMRVSSRELS